MNNGLQSKIRQNIQQIHSMRNISFSNKRSGKYNSKRSTYNGKNYDSILEANYAESLDWRKKAGEIKEIVPQFKLEINIEGVHICNYYVDFKVVLFDDTIEYHEVKGFETDLWRLKWRLAHAIYGTEKFVLIK